MELQYAFVEKTEKGNWLVKRKEGKEYAEEIIVLGTFDDKKTANDYRDDYNRRLFPEGHDRNPTPAYPSYVGYAKSGELPIEDLIDKEIFAAGTWTDMKGRTRKYTTSDLDAMVANFDALKSRFTPHMKLTHADQKTQVKFTGSPAVGWITKLQRKGKKLVADFARVPQKLAKLIRAGSYRRFSAEILPSFKDESTGKIYSNVVSAAALLGATHPAVNTLDDILELFGADSEAIAEYLNVESDSLFEGHGEPALSFSAFEPEPDEGGEPEMDAEQVKALIDDAVAPLKEEAVKFQSGICDALGIEQDADPVAAIKTMKTEKDDAVKTVTDRDVKEFSAKVNELILTAKKDGKLLPVAEPAVRAVVETLRKTEGAAMSYEGGDGETVTIEGDPIEWLTGYFAQLPVVVKQGKEFGKVGQKTTPKSFSMDPAISRNLGSEGIPLRVVGVGGNYADEITKYQTEHKCEFMTAWTAVTGLAPPKEPEVGAYSINEKDDEIIRS